MRRLAFMAGGVLFAGYLAAVTGGFLWLRYSRKVEQIRFVDIALFNLGGVRRSFAAQQFAEGKREWAAKNYQAAYVAYASAVRRDPGNVTGRLEAVLFFQALGASQMAQTFLEEGLALAPDDAALAEATFAQLRGTGQDAQLLKLVHRLYPAGPVGPNAGLVEISEVAATLVVEGAPAAQQLLVRYPAVLSRPEAAPVVASVYWSAAEKAKAIQILAAHVSAPGAAYAEYVQLTAWQLAEGRAGDARHTAESARTRFPASHQSSLLLMETHAATQAGGRPEPEEIAAYLRTYGNRPEARAQLAALAGSHGWVDLAGVLYQLGVARQDNLMALALSFCDALMTRSRFAQARLLLAQLEMQAPDADLALAVQLRQRQIIAAAAVGDNDNVREYARRLRLALGVNAGGLDSCRRLFSKLGITEAVAELTPRVAKPATAQVKG